MKRTPELKRVSLDLHPDVEQMVAEAAERVGMNKRAWITNCILRCLGRDPLTAEQPRK